MVSKVIRTTFMMGTVAPTSHPNTYQARAGRTLKGEVKDKLMLLSFFPPKGFTNKLASKILSYTKVKSSKRSMSLPGSLEMTPPIKPHASLRKSILLPARQEDSG